jgi:hypothetical protein
MLNTNTMKHAAKPVPDTILKSKSGSTKRLYKNETSDVAVHSTYDDMLALALLW